MPLPHAGRVQALHRVSRFAEAGHFFWRSTTSGQLLATLGRNEMRRHASLAGIVHLTNSQNLRVFVRLPSISRVFVSLRTPSVPWP